VCKYWSVRDNLKKKETRRKEEEENDKQTNKPNTHPFCAFLLSLSLSYLSLLFFLFSPFLGQYFSFFGGCPFCVAPPSFPPPVQTNEEEKLRRSKKKWTQNKCWTIVKRHL
jgi:hypothetical protein